MKSLIAIFSICLILPSFAFAQNKVSKKAKTTSSNSIQIIPQIGTVVSTVRFKDSSGTSITPQAGLSIGAGLLVPVDLYTSFETGLFYSRNQFNSRNESTGFVSQVDVVLERFSIPLLARVHPLNRTNGFYLKGGVLAHVQIGATLEGSNVDTFRDNNGQFVTQSESFEGFYGYDQGLRPVIMDATAGVGYNFEVSGSILSTELAYQRGLLGVDIEDNEESQIDSLSINMGLIF